VASASTAAEHTEHVSGVVAFAVVDDGHLCGVANQEGISFDEVSRQQFTAGTIVHAQHDAPHFWFTGGSEHPNLPGAGRLGRRRLELNLFDSVPELAGQGTDRIAQTGPIGGRIDRISNNSTTFSTASELTWIEAFGGATGESTLSGSI